jgi:hypothetical protein
LGSKHAPSGNDIGATDNANADLTFFPDGSGRAAKRAVFIYAATRDLKGSLVSRRAGTLLCRNLYRPTAIEWRCLRSSCIGDQRKTRARKN